MAEKNTQGTFESTEHVIEVEIERLRGFKNHPYSVQIDAQMKDLIESIERYGILTPLIVRPVPDGVYEIISGHRRKFAAQKLGYRKVPVIIRVMKDDSAIIAMVDANLQRENIAPSEKAYAYKMKYDAMVRQRGKNKGRQVGDNYKGEKTINVFAKQIEDSPRQVQRYIRLTGLIPELLKRLDEGELSINPAVELTFLSAKEQRMMLEAMDYAQAVPSLSQAQRIKALSKEKQLNLEIMKEIMSEIKKGEIRRVEFSNEQLHKFFPRDYSAAKMKREILAILKLWRERYW